ncbi:hypothetical protein CTA1_23 [Colletotrichum tanaceti]|uniref:Uncharacterized protein n=1 Tax=Colletotrichum tanaceti TaxID=1306861 RepID=A0A4U6XGN7_9PEZI|nr:hypothetical protein CTA1_23 [Colletotrichum tanaceti]
MKVQQNLAELLVRVRSVGLGNEERVVDKAVVEEAVRLLLASLYLGRVLLVRLLIERGEEVLGMDTDGLGTLLSETERRDGEGLDAIRLDRAARVHNHVELLHDGVHIVGVAVTGHQARVEDLQTAVQHPGTSGTLGVTSEVLLEDTHDGVALLATEVTELLANDRGLVLVVGLGRGSVEGGDGKVVDGETPRGEGTAERSNLWVVLPEVVSQTAEDVLLLALGLLLDMLGAVLSVLLLVDLLALGLDGLDLVVEILEFRLLPLLDLLLAKLDLAPAVVDVEQRRGELAHVFTRGGKNSLTGGGNGTANLVGGSGSQSQDTVDGHAHVEGELGRHDKLDTATLGFHEAVTGRGGGAGHLARGAAVGNLVDSVAGRLHVGELVRALLTKVVETTDKHHAGLALHDGLVTNVDGLDSSGASTDRGLDGTRRRDQQHVNPGGHGVDEGLLENVVLDGLIQVTVSVHATEGAGTTHTGSDAVADLGNVHVLVELVGVCNTGRQQSLSNGHQDEEGNRIDLGHNVLGNTVSLGIPASRDLSGNKSVESEGLGDQEGGSLLHADNVLAGLGDLKDLDLVAVLTLELLGSLLGRLEGLKVLLDDDLMEELLLLGVVAAEELRLNQTNTRVLEDELLVLLLDVLVVDGLTSLGVDPAGVGSGLALDGTVVVLDETHDPGHLNAALERELAVGLHLPASARVTPRTNLGEAGDNNDFLKVDHTLEAVVEGSNLLLPVGEVGEIELDVGAGLNNSLLVEGLRVGAVDDLVLNGVLLADGTTNLAGVHDVLAELGHGLVEVRDELQPTVQVGEDRLALAKIDNGGGQETQEVEGHLLLREGTDAERLDTLGNDVVAAHETGATSPANDGTADGEVVTPVLGVPPVEQGLQGKLGLRVQTVVTKGAVVGGQGQDNLGGTGLEAAVGLLGLDAAENAEQVGQHDAVSELRARVDLVDLATVLGNGGKRNDEVQVPTETVLGVVDVVNQSLTVLLATLVEGHNNELRAAGTETGVHGLVVLGDFTRESAGGDNHLGTTADETLQDLSSDGTSTGTRHESVLASKADTVLGGLFERLQVVAGELLAVVPAVKALALEVQEGNGFDLALGSGGRLRLLGGAVIVGNDLVFVHGQGAKDVAVQVLDLELGRLGHLVLLLDELVDAAEVVLDLGAVAILGDLAALGHLLNIVLQLAAAGAGDFFVVEVSTGVDSGLGASGNGNVLVDGVGVEDLLAVLDKLFTELLGELVGLATLGGAVVNVVLHELDQRGVGAVHDADALADNLTVNGLEAAKDDVVVHVEGILARPVPGRVVGTSLEGAEDGLNAGGVEVAVLGGPEVKLGLEHLLGLLRVDVRLVTGAEVELEVPRKELELLLEQSTLVFGQGVNGGRVHHHATARGAGSSTSLWSRQADAGGHGVLLCDIVKESLGVAFRSQPSGRLHGESKQQSTVLSSAAKTPSRLKVFSRGRNVETTRHLGGDQARDQGLRLLSELTVEGGLHGRAKLVQRNIFRLLWC